METDPETACRVYARTHPNHWIGKTAEDIPPGWIDDMIKRQVEEWNRQMLRVERTSSQVSDKKDASGNYEDDPDEREKHARTLSSLQRTLERLIAQETARAPDRKAKSPENRGEIRARLTRQLVEQIGPGRAREISGESE